MDNTYELKKIVRPLYLNGTSVEEIVDIISHKRSKNTLYNWIKDEEWDKEKSNAENIPQQQLEIVANLTNRLLELSKNEASSENKINALARSIERVTPKKEEITIVVNVLKELTYFLIEKELPKDEINKFANIYKEFIQWRVNNLKSQ